MCWFPLALEGPSHHSPCVGLHDHFVVGCLVDLLIHPNKINQFSVGLASFSPGLWLHGVPQGKGRSVNLWSRWRGWGLVSPQANPLCKRHPASSTIHMLEVHSLLGYVAHGLEEVMSLAGVAWSHIPPSLMCLVFRYNCHVLLGSCLYCFPLAFSLLCAYLTLQHVPSEWPSPN